MKVFTDSLGTRVELRFDESIEARHILVIPTFNGKYVFTRHKKRGVEFPGGKLEDRETIYDAVCRELFEETGAKVKTITYLGTYTVYDEEPFNKAAYKVEVDAFIEKCDYHETLGPVLYEHLEDIHEKDKSILLKDPCIQYLYDQTKTM
ncbi:NUDIX domain-containing protein [Phocicoccus pinnipedialis]|uniref:8-oxo-dGTP diphosphatase YtkD n=1 Tax=Phocicoccus pinnipedialis TaxID=110845 RepID=A0A6V7RBU3_9BACL|nr:NUDIX domain-containing protein [Jeotgalicoccus pinnipedialis]MBP1939572.1 8-oxo-dGTP diphosphatase [Jeotgalicoccus pinnipedialis]CAD2074927.1 Putative 8-oxo-dGTP diphosphatase YtkD [Jeotgalicoccus pinnipedialis]